MKLLFAIEQRSKSLPYPRDEREDGVNIGFQPLKGAAESDILAIPETADSLPLRQALLALNAKETDLFTVGCEKSLNLNQTRHWKKGYLEFAYNYAEVVADAVPYFVLFFHFQQAADTRKFIASNRIQFIWEIQGVRFTKISRDGFACCVWITTGEFETAAECERVWGEAVRLLTRYLASCRIKKRPTSPLTPIYDA